MKEKKLALTNAQIFDGTKIIDNHAIFIENEKILKIVEQTTNYLKNCEHYTVIDLKNLLIAPGFIDLQINGCGEIILNDDPSIEKINYMKEINFQNGTTTILPTLVTTDTETIEKALISMKKFHAKYGKNNVPGLHIEGPFISENKSGIHNKKFIRNLTIEDEKILTKYSTEISMLTISPERLSEEQLKTIKELGIKLSIGHSSLSYDDVIDLLPKYFTCSTHTFNAMTSILNARNPGIIPAIADANIYAGIIPDLFHVHPSLLRLSKKLFGTKLFIVTDALASANAGQNFKQFLFCNKLLTVSNKGYCADENGTLGGSSLTLDQGIKNLIKECNYSLDEALATATSIPSKVLGLDHLIGNIKENLIANFAIIDPKTIEVKMTISNGEIVYKK